MDVNRGVKFVDYLKFHFFKEMYEPYIYKLLLIVREDKIENRA